MDTLNSCSPDYTQFSIEHFEFAYEGLNKLNNAAGDMLCQPRATYLTGRLHQGALIVQLHAEAMQKQAFEIIDFLRTVHFSDDDQDVRRRRLIAKFDLEHSDRSPEEVLQAPRRAAGMKIA